MLPKDILRGRKPSGAYRFAFVHPGTQNFMFACRAMEGRGLLRWGPNPITVPGVTYNSWYTDIPVLDEVTYARYAMLVRDFFPLEAQQKFNMVYAGPGTPAEVRRSINNPANYLKAQQPVIDFLVDKYAAGPTPLTFYGTKFSAEGVALFLDSMKNKEGRRGAINNFEPGLGKTRIGAIGTIESGLKRFLIIAPKTPRATAWPDELSRLRHPNDYQPIDEKNWETNKPYSLLQWDSLRLMPDRFFAQAQYDLVLADEFHFISNSESARSQALERLMLNVRWLWGMTGTLLRKRPSDAVNPLVLIRHPLLCTNGARDDDKVTWFNSRYCGEWLADEQRWDFKKPKNLSEMHAVLRDSVIRHETSETGLPGQLFIPMEVDFTDREVETMEQAWHDYCSDPVNQAKMKSPTFRFGAVRLGIMLRAAALLMVPHTLEWAEGLIAQGHKVILFTSSTEVYNKLRVHFGQRCVGVDGRTTSKKRAEAERLFQNDDQIDAFVGNIQAAGISLTLTRASYLGFNDLGWITSDNEQAGKRNNRGGSTEVGQNFYFYAPGTPLETVFNDHRKSLMVIDQATRVRDKSGVLVQSKKSMWLPARKIKT